MQSINEIDEIEAHFVATSEHTFNRTPYKRQSDVGSTILRAHQKEDFMSFLLVRPTGGGKTLVFNTLAACLKGVTLCISHLLSLGANQTQKVMESACNDRSISSFHLDEMSNASIQAVLHDEIKI